MGWKDAPVVAPSSAWASAPVTDAPIDPTKILPYDATKDLSVHFARAQQNAPQSFPAYYGQALKEMAIPAATTALGSAIGNLPGAMTGSALGETLNQALGIGTPKSVIPDANTPNLTRIATAGAAPAVIPGLMRIGAGAKALVEPLYQKGREQVLGRLLRHAAGDQADDVARTLLQAKPIIAGSQPTVGQASQNPGLASLERAASAIDPEAAAQYQMRMMQQNAARVKILADLAGTDDAMAAALAARKTASAPFMAKLNASTATVNPKRTLSLIDTMIEKSPGRTQLASALQSVKRAIVDPEGLVQTNPGKLYRGARKQITDLLAAKAGDGSPVNKEISRELTLIKDALDKEIGRADPAYRVFLDQFARNSEPINQMDMGRKIMEKSVSPLTDTLRPEAYARSLSNQVARQATGFKRATLAKTLTPDQLASLNAVKADVARAAMADRIAGTKGSDTIKKLAYANMIDRFGVPTFLREFAPTQITGNLAARSADVLYSRANKELASELAETLMNSQRAGQLMQHLGPQRYQALLDAMMKVAPVATGAVVGRPQGE